MPAVLGGVTDVGTIVLGNTPTVTIGFPGTGGNCFPFTCRGFPGARYQQVYNSGLFPGVMTITNISFFNTILPGASINSATYTIHISTTAKPVNGLDIRDFDSNVGADDALFFSGVLGGPIEGGKFTITGAPFLYDPSQGNLLIDIFKSGGGPTTGFLDARNGSFGNESSRAHNFGSAFASWGLVTEFNSATEVLLRTLDVPEEGGPVEGHNADGSPP